MWGGGGDYQVYGEEYQVGKNIKWGRISVWEGKGMELELGGKG